MPTTSLLAFALASLLLAVTPGPAVVLVVANGVADGRRAGLATALGLALGTSTWVAVVAAGLGAVLAARPGLVGLVQGLGGTYLLAVGWQRWQHAGDVVVDGPAAPAGRPLRDGAVVNLLNPSIAVFLTAVLPPFLVPAPPAVGIQVLLLGTVLLGVSTLVNGAYGLAGDLAGERVRANAGSRRTGRLVAVVHVLLGLVALGAALG